MILTTPDPRTWCSTLWYPQGSGGMWLNYLVWCNKQQTTIPESFQMFEFENVRRRSPKYYSSFIYMKHTATQEEANSSDVRIGGNNWFNFYLNICVKKKMADIHYRGVAESLLAIMDNNVTPNLYWQDIIKSPEKFLNNLSLVLKKPVKYNHITQQAIGQYIQSCSFPKLNNEFQNSKLYQGWAQALSDIKNIKSDNEIFEFTRANYCSPE
jgi:hypothetical protein